MKYRYLFALNLTFLFSLLVMGSESTVITFKTWKSKKIDEATSIVIDLKSKIRALENTKMRPPYQDENEGSVARKLSQAQFNLALTKELSANDYVMLYLNPFFSANHAAVLRAAKSLNPKDVADIIEAYQNKLSSTKSAELLVPKVSVEPVSEL